VRDFYAINIDTVAGEQTGIDTSNGRYSLCMRSTATQNLLAHQSGIVATIATAKKRRPCLLLDDGAACCGLLGIQRGGEKEADRESTPRRRQPAYVYICAP